MWLMFQVIDTPDAGTDWTQILVTIVVTFGVCFTAVMSYLGVKAGKAAKEEAAKTQKYNTEDHGRVVEALTALRDEVAHLGGRLDDVGRNVGTLRDQFVGHLQHHLDKEA